MPQWDQLAGQWVDFLAHSQATYVVAVVIVAWLVAYMYYRRVVAEVRQETRRVAQLANLMLRIMEGNGLAVLRRDERGEIVGATVKCTPTDKEPK